MTDVPHKLSWNQPVCERCWIDREGTWDERGRVDVLIALRLPVRMVDPPLEQCAFCGSPTFIGVYQRVNPATVPFPAKEPVDE